MPIRILAVDDHALMREGITAVIERELDMTVVGEASSGEEAIEQFRALQPDVTLMDLQMRGMNGVETITRIKAEFPEAVFLVLTTYKTDTHALRALRAGAKGYLLKNALRKELVSTVRAVYAGRRAIDPEIASELADHSTDEALSSREAEVLRLVASGNANRTVATLLKIGDETVKAHMKNILSKLGARDRTHAVSIAIRRGIIDP